MKRMVKWVLGLVGSLLLLLLVAAVAAMVFVDPNDYRETISAEVKEQTGRELQINGEINLSLFPWLGLELGEMELGNAKGFDEKPFARIEAAEARVKLLPLFKLQTEIDTVLLRGLVLNLHRRDDGSSNWDDLAGPDKATASQGTKDEQTSKASKSEDDGKKLEQILAALAIGGIALENANVSWQDDLNNQQLQLRQFNFKAGEIRIGERIPLSLSTELTSSQPAVDGSIAFAAGVTAEPIAQRFSADAMNLQLAFKGDVLPGGKLEAALSGDVAADLKAQQATLKNVKLKGMGADLDADVSVQKLLSQPDVQGEVKLVLRDVAKLLSALPKDALPPTLKPAALSGSTIQAKLNLSLGGQTVSLSPLTLNAAGVALTLQAKGQQIIDKPAFSGKLSSNEFVPRLLLEELGIALPEMADPSVLGKAKLESSFNGGLDSVALSDLSLQLDDTRFSGKASVSKFVAPVIRYSLVLDGIDVDRYLPPPAEQASEKESEKPAQKSAASQQAASSPALPLELLRSLDIDGSFKVGKVKVMNLHSDSIVTQVRAKQGKFRVHPLSANLYQGSYSGNLGFDVSGDTPRLSMDEKLKGVQSGPLLKDFMGKEYVTGEANMSAKMTARGLDAMAIRKTLNGSGRFQFANGTVNGINIGQMIRKAYAAYKKQPSPKDEQRSTDFANLSGSFLVKNGLVSTKDLSARSPLFQVAGKGTVNLPREKLDLRLDTTIVSDIRDATGQSMGDLRGEKIPVTIKGSFSDPKFGVDVGGVLEAKAKAALEKEKKKAEKKLKKEVDKKKKSLEKDLQKKLEKMLKF